MKDKYWAKNKYSKVNPADYENIRFGTNAGKLIDEAEKKAVLKLLKKYIPKTSQGTYRILDVATGPGRLAFYLEKHLPPADITGVDINDNMLEKARRFAQENRSKVKFVTGDIYKLPFIDSQFDAVVGLRFSMHIPNLDIVLKELSRVVKEKGLVVFDIFNKNSILRIRNVNQSPDDNPYNSLDEMRNIASEYNLKLQEFVGVLPLGETVYRRMPSQLLFLLRPFLRCPEPFAAIATKLILCFRK